MYFYLDTTSRDFVLALYDKDFNLIDSVYLREYPKKVHLIVSEFQKMIEKNEVSFDQILGLMTNLGPGYFTGVRSSLVFFRTLAMTWNVPIFTINSFEILVQQKPLQKQYYLDAQGSKLFYYENKFDVVDVNKIDVIDSIEVEIDKIDFNHLIQNMVQYLEKFDKNTDVLDIKPLYVKQPQIGVKKC